MRVDFNFGAQSRDTSIDTAIVDHDLISPNGIEDLVPRQRPAGARDKEFQELEFLGRKQDFCFVAEQLVPVNIEFARTE